MTTKCAGMNCQSTDGANHSPECRAEHAAAVAGGRFVKLPRGDAGARDGELISRLLYAEKGSDNPHDKAMLREAAERLTALSASTEATGEPVCKLCCSIGEPCAYPTEINRQQAKRIADLERAASGQKQGGDK